MIHIHGVPQYNLVEKYVISDDILQQNTKTTNTSGAYTKLIEIDLVTLRPTPITMRIAYECHQDNYGYCGTKIYKNGGDTGFGDVCSQPAWKTVTFDIEFAEGDSIELWGKGGGTGHSINVKNLRILGKLEPVIVTTLFDATNIP